MDPPFYISDRELEFSKERANQYRVYELKAQPRIFILREAVDEHVSLRARNFEASFGRI